MASGVGDTGAVGTQGQGLHTPPTTGVGVFRHLARELVADMRKYVITDMRVVPSRGGHHMEILCYCSHSAIATWIRPDSLPYYGPLVPSIGVWV